MRTLIAGTVGVIRPLDAMAEDNVSCQKHSGFARGQLSPLVARTRAQTYEVIDNSRQIRNIDESKYLAFTPARYAPESEGCGSYKSSFCVIAA
jgi:hypothetical protein